MLRLFGGSPRERGFAQGFLLAEEIRDVTDAALRSLPNMTPEKYEGRILPWARKFDWDADAKAELDGIFEGMSARLSGEALRLPFAGRLYSRADLDVVNVIADYYGPACSAFTVWGKRSAGAGVLHARTLDFPVGARAVKEQIVIVSEPSGSGGNARRGWVAVGWPGLIVQFTGMNSAGLVACLHDGYNIHKGREIGMFYPRGLMLRRLLETIDPAQGDPARKAADDIASHKFACGNLFHMSWPSAAAKKNEETCSAVLEFEMASHQVEIRRMDDSGALVVTNQFFLLNKPAECGRFKRISDGLELLQKANRPVGMPEARKLLMSAEQFVAAHSVYFFPDKLELQIALTKENIMSPRVAPTPFSLKELFERQPPANSSRSN